MALLAGCAGGGGGGAANGTTTTGMATTGDGGMETTTAGETANVRVAHMSPDAPAVDVTATGVDGALFDGLAFGDATYVEVPGGDYTVQVRPDTGTNDGEVAAEFDVSLGGGQVYTAFAAGYLTPSGAPADTPFDLIVVQDTGGMSG